MKLESQVCSLELSRKLKTLGVKQESVFKWMLLPKKDDWTVQFHTDNTNFSSSELSIREWEIACETSFPAFTCSELGEMLKEKCPMAIEGENLVAGKWNIDSFTANTEADARAKMLVYLLENDLIN